MMRSQFFVLLLYNALVPGIGSFKKINKSTIFFLLLLCIFSQIHAGSTKFDNSSRVQLKSTDSTKVKDLLAQSIKYSYSDYDKAFEIANQALILSKAIKYDIGIIKSNYELGAISIMKGDSNSAYSYFNGGLNRSQEVENEVLTAFGYFHMSRYFLDINDYLRSIEQINKAHVIFEKLNKSIEISRCYSSLANIYENLSNYEQSLFYNFKSLRIKESIGDERGISIVLGNIGNVYLQTDRYEEARTNFSKALELDRQNKDREGEVYGLLMLGVAHQKMKKYTKAMIFFKMALPIARDLKFRIDESILLGNIGSTLREQHKYQESLDYLFQALEIKKKLNRSSSASQTYNDICETYLSMGKATEAKTCALKAIEYSENVNLEQKKVAYSLLAKCNYLLGDFKGSYDNLLVSSKLEDSIFSIEKASNMNEMGIKYQTEKKEKEILSLTEENQSAEIKRDNYIIGGLVTSFFLILLYNTQRVKSVKNKFLLEKRKEVDLMKSLFFTNVSHEFRTPLTLILGPLDELIEKIEQTAIKNRLKLIKKNGVRLLDLVNQLLDLSKIESGKLDLETSKSDIIKVIKGVSMSFHSMAESKKINLKLKTFPDELIINFDKEKLETIIINLLSNAIKFTPEYGKIRVKTRIVKKIVEKKRSEFISIVVSDSGIGIPKSDIGHIFNRFYQSERNQLMQHGGTGIGLAILKELVELHKGQVRVKSKVGKGTKFIVEIPTNLPDYFHSEGTSEEMHNSQNLTAIEDVILATDVEGVEEVTNEKPVILLIEDHIDVRNYIKEILEINYNLLSANDGEEGIAKALAHIPDLILSDVMMPKKNGYQVCEKLKLDERTSHIPIVLLTAKSSSEDKVEGLLTKADDYITKPFNPKELLIRLKNLIDSRKLLKERYKKEGILRPKEIAVNSIDEKFLNRLIELVELHLSDENFGVKILSEKIGMSRSQLHRKLIAILDQGPNQFIRTYRLQRAHDLLKQNAASTSEISYQVGFGSPSYFTKCFHKHFGYTPSEVIDQSNTD